MKALSQKQTQVTGRELEEVCQLFERWRQQRKLGARIPTELWEAAVSLFPRYTVNQISRSLRLDFVDVRKRVGHGKEVKKKVGAGDSRFWELRFADSQTQIHECRLRAEDGCGRKVELELKDIGAEPLLQLLGGLWGKQS